MARPARSNPLIQCSHRTLDVHVALVDLDREVLNEALLAEHVAARLEEGAMVDALVTHADLAVVGRHHLEAHARALRTRVVVGFGFGLLGG